MKAKVILFLTVLFQQLEFTSLEFQEDIVKMKIKCMDFFVKNL